MANSADPDKVASSDLHCLQRQDIYGFSRARVKIIFTSLKKILENFYHL